MSDRLTRLLAPQSKHDDVQRAAIAAAAILLELSGSDNNTTAVELGLVRDTLATTYKLDSTAIDEVMAATRDVRDVDEHVAYVRQHFSQSEKWKVVDAMKSIIWSDDHIDRHEAQLAALLASGLGLPLAELERLLKPS